MRSFSGVEEKVVRLEMAQIRSDSAGVVEVRMAESACDQVGGLGLVGERMGWGLSLRRPMSLHTLTN